MLVVVALVLALVIKTFAIQAFYIPSASMQNTLEIGDRVLINKVVYHPRPSTAATSSCSTAPGRGTSTTPRELEHLQQAVSELEGIVGISHDSSIYIKRVIGLPGDHVACCNAKGRVTVNGVPLSEQSYLYPGNLPSDRTFSITVPPGRLWVMGDHRGVSYDSRGHMGDPGGGTIPESAVLGRAFVIIWPPSRWGFLNIPATFEQPQLNASDAAAGGSTAALAAAMDNGTPVQAAGSALPLALGFAGAVPLTWLQRPARRRLKSRRSRRNASEAIEPAGWSQGPFEMTGNRRGGDARRGAPGTVGDLPAGRQAPTVRPEPARPGRGWRTLRGEMVHPGTRRGAAPGSPPTRTCSRAPGWRRSRASTRPGAGHAPGPWWSPPSCSTRSRSGGCRGLADSKLLTPAAREDAYAHITRQGGGLARGGDPAPTRSTGFGLHVCNVEGMRRACAGLRSRAGIRADRRLPGARPRLARARGVEGRPGGRVGRRGLDRRQGDQGPDDARAR